MAYENNERSFSQMARALKKNFSIRSRDLARSRGAAGGCELERRSSERVRARMLVLRRRRRRRSSARIACLFFVQSVASLAGERARVDGSLPRQRREWRARDRSTTTTIVGMMRLLSTRRPSSLAADDRRARRRKGEQENSHSRCPRTEASERRAEIEANTKTDAVLTKIWTTRSFFRTRALRRRAARHTNDALVSQKQQPATTLVQTRVKPQFARVKPHFAHFKRCARARESAQIAD